jgi:hypothetical protein
MTETSTLARPQAPWALRLVPPFPAIAHRLLAMVGQDDASVQDVGNLVKMDPSFSAELLRFANSALFGSRREVQSLSRAIAMVGLDRIKTMATLVAMNRMVRSCLVTAFITEEARPRLVPSPRRRLHPRSAAQPWHVGHDGRLSGRILADA